MISLPPEHLATITAILAEHVPEAEVRAFGSRIGGTARQYSDLDLAIVGEKKVELRVMARLRDAFQESKLPFRVDLLDWRRISPEFRARIEQNYVVIREAEKVTAAH
ncbi:MAG: nucleotidyltransferase domain-containing protein [Candidatus Hydrogenedentes bacterium]|nr:nucleotidyltransferase domain-containing protein [Candidatus Hydrogenedentota bacterium]